MRVMHISFGFPLISAEHEPHLPALQFQRTARSFANSAWILWTASSTTIPSEMSVGYSRNSPPPGPVRQILKTKVDILFQFVDDLLQVGSDLFLLHLAYLHAT